MAKAEATARAAKARRAVIAAKARRAVIVAKARREAKARRANAIAAKARRAERARIIDGEGDLAWHTPISRWNQSRLRSEWSLDRATSFRICGRRPFRLGFPKSLTVADEWSA